MEKKSSSNIAIDPNWDENTPNIVTATYEDNLETDELEKPSASPVSLPVSIFQRIVNFFLDFLETIVVALSIFVVVYLFLVQPHEVKGGSMEPNFYNNEYILTDKISYKFSPPVRGDVIIFESPTNPDLDYIKRIIALPGEKIKIQHGQVFVNGQRLDELYLSTATYLPADNSIHEGEEITIPEGSYFVMGDNRPNSSDSRVFNAISEKRIVGKAFLRYWPPSKFGLILKISYHF